MGLAREQQLLRQGTGHSQSLSLDEIALRKGHGNFETVISTERRVLTLLPGKSSEGLQGFLKSLPGIERIQQVSMDMCASFAHAIKAILPWAQIVIDRFHLIKHLNEAVEQYRKRTHAQLDPKERKRFSRIHFLLSKEYKSLNKDERRQVKEYLRLNPAVKEPYWLAQGFRRVLAHPWKKKENAWIALRDWCEGARRLLPRFVKTVEHWWTPVLNACLFSLSNGRQEGINNKIKLIKRQGFGYRNRQLFKLKVLAAFNP